MFFGDAFLMKKIDKHSRNKGEAISTILCPHLLKEEIVAQHNLVSITGFNEVCNSSYCFINRRRYSFLREGDIQADHVEF